MTHTHHGAFEAFSVTAALILLALVYMRGWVRVRRLDRHANRRLARRQVFSWDCSLSGPP